jgi:predicted Rossmann fold flavoprotein
MQTQFDVIVIGAGAAGMMCAAQAGQRGRSVLLVDHAEVLGERIRISGGGRCNFTNREVTASNFLSQNPDFCRSALARFSAQDFIALVQHHGIAWHEKTLGQLFCDDSAQRIIDLLRNECEDGAVQWAMPCSVRAVRAMPGENAHHSARYELDTSRGRLQCHSLVIASGGLAIPKLGASPFGYRLAEQFGIAVVPPQPALVPLALAPELLQELASLSGLSLTVSACCDISARPDGTQGRGKANRQPPAAAFREQLLLTHRGLSGPAALQVSSYWQMQNLHSDGANAARQPIRFDLLPGIDAEAWLESEQHSRALPASLLSTHWPRRLAQAWCALYQFEQPLQQMSAQQRQALAQQLKQWQVMPSGTLGFAKAEVTLGGVDTRALSSRTLEVQSQPGLHFIGEVVDVTGWLGGYNFQWAWSSGWAAGQVV